MDIRELTEVDRAQAVDLWADVGLTRPWNDPEDDFNRARAGASSTLLGVLDGLHLAATVMVGHDGHRGWVYYLAVRSDRRGQGLGRRMMEAAEGWLRGEGVPNLNLMIRHSNAEAVAFYERLGYQDAEVTVLARRLDLDRST